MKHLLLGLVLLIGCASAPAVPVTSPATAAAITSDPFKDLLSLLGDVPKPPTPLCLKNGCVYNIHDEIDDEMAKDFTAWMASVKANHVVEFTISLDTPGGAVDDGFVIIHALEDAAKEGVKSTCKVDGLAASMGFAVLQVCSVRQMTRRSSLMAHEVKINFKGRMNQTDAENVANMLAADNRALAEHCASRMKVTIDEYLDKTTHGKEWYMAWEEALKVKAVDSVIAP